jgi:CubicO group peptidase (beta-lactamase class C family)
VKKSKNQEVAGMKKNMIQNLRFGIIITALVVWPIDATSEGQEVGAPAAQEIVSPAQDSGEHKADPKAATLPEAPAISPEALAEFIDGLVAAHRTGHQLAALTLAVVKDDALWMARGYGAVDLESEKPVSADRTLFRIGSVSKTFTWTAVMMLAERGRIDLDADVNTYLKAVKVREEFGRPVTMRHLMHHRAGFEDSFRLFAVSDDDPRTLAEILAAHQPARVFPPGMQFAYSNWGAALAAQIVEDVIGMPYGDFLQREILDPLKMRDTTWAPPSAMAAALRERQVSGYRPEKGALGPQGFMQIGAYWPAGGMASTAVDMSRWMRFHLNGGELEGVRLLSAETHAAMWTRAFTDLPPEATDIAHGFIDRPHRGLRTLGHSGGTAAFLTNMVLVPELRLGIFMSQNNAREFAPMVEIPALVLDRFLGYSYRPSLVEKGDGKVLAELAGTYYESRRVFTSFSAILALATAATVEPVSDRSLVLSAQGRSDYFQRMPGAGELFENASGDRLAVIRNEKGKVRALTYPWGILEKAAPLRTPGALFAAFGLAVLLALTTTLGAWKRFGRRDAPGLASRLIGGVALAAVLAVVLLIAAIVGLSAGMGDFDLSKMAGDYPNAGMYLVHYAGWIIAAAALAMIVALWVVWMRSGWGIVRRLHFTLFAGALAFLTVQLWLWRIIGAGVY